MICGLQPNVEKLINISQLHSVLNIVENKNVALLNNQAEQFSLEVEIPTEINNTFPYWLHKKGTMGMYAVSDENLISLPETPREIKVDFMIDFNGVTIPFSKEVIYKYNDPVKGEVYQPFEVLPEVSASFPEKVHIFADGNMQKIAIKVKALKDNPPVNIKVFIEGEEEIGSPCMAEFLDEYQDDLEADVIIIADSGNIKIGTPTVTTSLRGLVDGVIVVEQPMSAARSNGMSSLTFTKACS